MTPSLLFTAVALLCMWFIKNLAWTASYIKVGTSTFHFVSAPYLKANFKMTTLKIGSKLGSFEKILQRVFTKLMLIMISYVLSIFKNIIRIFGSANAKKNGSFNNFEK